MNLWEAIAVGDRDGPGFPGPGDTLTRAERRDLDADRLAHLEATVYAQRQELARLHRWCAATWATVAELKTCQNHTFGGGDERAS